jgi:thiol-disulfide isomerase/thioredoxin
LIIVTATLAICAAYAGYLLNQKHRVPPPPASVAVTETQALSYWSFADTDGRERHMSEWAGQIVVVNFWATWCPPCRKEIPAFIALQERLAAEQVTFIGIAFDRLEAVKPFIAEQGVNYPILIGEEAVAQYMRSLGNTIGALPFSALIGRDGRVLVTHQGEWHEADVEKAIRDAL